ncbi:52 kDa repressor of the inhibitor of the protein kinase-like [Aphis craccivora]|uniref:52 kDa repressor of the inhibitor of the protein kinase-like n=1 Tax=Aphis craccivora TaxID=307492 RepID=A0A6G0VZ04_APHCR|nr:52 kDa repressor of the inhibitor of the protein kinase-like [Aphis craccivora]
MSPEMRVRAVEIKMGENPPKDVFQSIEQCHALIFPLIRELLLILGTLPVSVASAERNFSILRRLLKTWLRSQMGQIRLTGLALMHVHRNIDVNVNNIIDRFAKNKRKIDFISNHHIGDYMSSTKIGKYIIIHKNANINCNGPLAHF